MQSNHVSKSDHRSCLAPLLFSIFILDLKNVIPEGIAYKLCADDLKLYAVSETIDQRRRIQKAIDSVQKWCDENDMILSTPKCAVLCSKQQHMYTLNGEILPVVSSVKDLGVIMTPELDFSLHITKTIQSASLICNTILRCFIIKKPEFYVGLFKSLVLPRFIYCSEVWRPYLKKHVEAIERVRSKFIRRVSIRCNVEKDSVKLPLISQMHIENDLRMYNRLQRTNNLSRYLNIRENNLRSNQTVSTVEVARTERVNNMFAWRMVRILRH